MSPKLHSQFTATVDGIIWKTIADVKDRLFIEIRNTKRKLVSFSCVDLESASWILEGYKFEEPWWISLQATSGDMAFFTIYADQNNPDKKSLLALDILAKEIRWFRNDFSFSVLSGDTVIGVDTKFGSREVALRTSDGTTIQRDFTDSFAEQNFIVVRPFQYHEGTTHFDTVKTFLQSKVGILPVITLEYCEFNSLIVISAFVNTQDLANYLFVFDSKGEILLKEALGEHLQGIALDTFFLFSGFLIFVKNKCELVSYKIL